MSFPFLNLVPFTVLISFFVRSDCALPGCCQAHPERWNVKKTEHEWREARWRTKATVGLIGLGAWIGSVLWFWHGGLGELDLPRLVEMAGESAGNVYFWAVVGLCAALGGWLAWVLFWRGRRHKEPEAEPPGGMSGPRF